MAITLQRVVSLGIGQAGLSTVGYSLFNSNGTANGTRVTGTGITERPAGSGNYTAMVTFPNGFVGVLQWDTGGATPVYAIEDFNLKDSIVIDQAGGVSIAATGLDSMLTDVTSDTDARSGGFKMLRAIFNRFYNRVTQTATTQVVANDAGTTTSSMATSDDGTTVTKAKSA